MGLVALPSPKDSPKNIKKLYVQCESLGEGKATRPICVHFTEDSNYSASTSLENQHQRRLREVPPPGKQEIDEGYFRSQDRE